MDLILVIHEKTTYLQKKTVPMNSGNLPLRVAILDSVRLLIVSLNIGIFLPSNKVL